MEPLNNDNNKESNNKDSSKNSKILEFKLKPVKVKNGIEKEITPALSENSKVMIKKGAGELSYKYKLINSVNAPVKKGDSLGEIVIENEYISTKLPLNYDNDLKTLFSLYIDYDTILNRSNKHAYYVEMMTKAFLVCERGAYSQSDSILDNKKLWYDETRASQVFPLMKQIKTLKETAAKAKSIADRSEYNKKIRQTISELERLMHNE